MNKSSFHNHLYNSFGFIDYTPPKHKKNLQNTLQLENKQYLGKDLIWNWHVWMHLTHLNAVFIALACGEYARRVNVLLSKC